MLSGADLRQALFIKWSAMPWQSIDDLPETVRSVLPATALSRFRSVANAALADELSESEALRAAWASVKQDWEKGPDGKWVAKGATSVNIDIEKLGARNSTLDARRIQLMHDTAVELGAVCHSPDDVGKRSTAKERTLYVKRVLKDPEPFIAWAKSQGFQTTLLPGDLHVTVAYSRAPMLWPDPQDGEVTANLSDGRAIERLGDGGAVVLKFRSPHLLARWDYLRSIGATWDWPSYIPHITISWDAADVNIEDVAPYKQPLVFGPEIFQELNEDWKESITEKTRAGKVLKVRVSEVDTDLGVVFGWAIISKIKGVDYFDVQDDHIPERSMLIAATGYMQGRRVAGNMHRQIDAEGNVERVGTVIFAWPMTAEIKKSMGLKSDFTGLMVGMKVDSPKVLEKFRSGAYTGFSIGGRRIVDKEVS